MAKKRQKKEPISTDQINAESLLAMMLEYHKALAKEARADQKALRAARELAMAAKETKLALDNARIDQLKAEAKERFDRAMEAATASIVTGILRGDVNALGDWTITVPFNDFEKSSGKKSDLIQLQIRHQEDEVEKAARRVAGASDAADDSRKRKTRSPMLSRS
jgi:hypothetical protein